MIKHKKEVFRQIYVFFYHLLFDGFCLLAKKNSGVDFVLPKDSVSICCIFICLCINFSWLSDNE